MYYIMKEQVTFGTFLVFSLNFDTFIQISPSLFYEVSGPFDIE